MEIRNFGNRSLGRLQPQASDPTPPPQPTRATGFTGQNAGQRDGGRFGIPAPPSPSQGNFSVGGVGTGNFLTDNRRPTSPIGPTQGFGGPNIGAQGFAAPQPDVSGFGGRQLNAQGDPSIFARRGIRSQMNPHVAALQDVQGGAPNPFVDQAGEDFNQGFGQLGGGFSQGFNQIGGGFGQDFNQAGGGLDPFGGFGGGGFGQNFNQMGGAPFQGFTQGGGAVNPQMSALSGMMGGGGQPLPSQFTPPGLTPNPFMPQQPFGGFGREGLFRGGGF